MKILIVDDSKAMRMIVARTLKQAGFAGHEFVEAADGQEAWDRIHDEEPDVVLCDWNMPVKSGIELLFDLRNSDLDVKFGFVTSEATQEMREQAMDSGAAFFVTKPFTTEALRVAVASSVR